MDWGIAAGLVVAIFLVYGQALSFGFVNYDDPDYVTGNPHVKAGFTVDGVAWAFRHSFAGNWFPLTWLSHMTDVQLFGLNAGPHHLTNICLHALSAVLLFLFLQRVTKARWPSATVAALFALHPLHVESVAWIAERKDVLSAFFWMLTLWIYAGYAARPGRVRYGLTLLAFALGSMAKPMLVTLPLVLMLLDYWPLGRGLKIVEKLPFFVLSAACAVVTFLVHRDAGATASLDIFPLGLRLENALVSYAVYARQMFWPGSLAVFYPYSRSGLGIEAGVAAVVLIAVTVYVIGVAGTHRYVFVGWVWFLVTLVPVIGLLQVGAQARADRYMYIPSIGLSIALVWGAAEVLRRWPRVASGLAVAFCAIYAVLAWSQVRYWQDGVSLFRHTVEVTQNNYMAQFNLASALNSAGDSTRASKELAETVRIEPRFAMAHAELGQLLSKQGQVTEAVAQLQTAEKLSPTTADIHLRLATVLADHARENEAVPEFLEAIRLDPANPDAHYNLGLVEFNKGKLGDAASQFADAVRLRPEDGPAHFNLAVALARMGRRQEAIAELTEAVRIDPNLPGAREALQDALSSK